MKLLKLRLIVMIFLILIFSYSTQAREDARLKKLRHRPKPKGNITTEVYLENNLVRIQVDDTNGSFYIGTSSQHPTRPCERLLYGFECYENEPWSTRILVNVDGSYIDVAGDYTGCDGRATHQSTVVENNQRIRSTFTYNYLTIQIVHTPVQFGQNSAAILTETYVTNNDNSMHNIGVMYEYDTMVANNDGAQIAIEGQWYEYETCFDNPNFVYWEAFENTIPPGPDDLVARGTISGGDATMPDRFALGYWSNFYDVCWSYTCTGETYDDSAVLYWWNPVPLAPGQTRRVATYYGIGEVQVTPGELSISLSYPTQLSCNQGNITPNPFPLTAYISNTGGQTCNNVVVQLSLGQGLSTSDPLTVSLGNISPNQNAQAYWDIQALGDPCDTNISFTVSVTSDNCSNNSANGSVNVPCCYTPTPAPIPELTISGLLLLILILTIFLIKVVRGK